MMENAQDHRFPRSVEIGIDGELLSLNRFFDDEGSRIKHLIRIEALYLGQFRRDLLLDPVPLSGCRHLVNPHAEKPHGGFYDKRTRNSFKV